MIGPIKDENGQKYYLSVCKHGFKNNRCFAEDGKLLQMYACQITTNCNSDFCVAKSLGDFIGFHELPAGSGDEGFILRYSHGDVGCGGKERELNVTFICDPSAGRGTPRQPEGRLIEGSPCAYNVEWRSIYGCPICSEEHYEFEYSACFNGKRTKSAHWLSNPKRCHGGVELPADEVVTSACDASTAVCAAGEFLGADGACAKCPAGKYSKGAALYFKNVPDIPADFSTKCTSDNCTPFAADHGLIVSGNGDSELTFAADVLSDGAVSFKYYQIVPGDGKAYLTFAVDGEEVLRDAEFTDQEELDVSFPLKRGAHVLRWRFFGGSNALTDYRSAFVTLKSITVEGADYSPASCRTCPAGTVAAAAGASKCTRCPANTHPNAARTACVPCGEGQYAFPGSDLCSPSKFCTRDDFAQFSTACADGQRTLYWEANQPKLCVSNEREKGSVLPQNATAACVCPSGFVDRADKCVSCPQGEVATDGGCAAVADGAVALASLKFFPRERSTPLLPPRWSTSCVGQCADGGMRMTTDGVSVGRTDIRAGVADAYELSLPQSTRRVKLVYAQSGSVSSGEGRRAARDDEASAIVISDVVITGVDGQVAADEFPEHLFTTEAFCMRGSVAADSYCKPCPLGTAEKDGGCVPCEGNTVASRTGAVSCTPCDDGTVANPEKTECVVQPSFAAGNTTYQISAIPAIGPLAAQGSLLYVVLQNTTFEGVPACTALGTHACAVSDSGARDFGSRVTVAQDAENESITVTIGGGAADALCPRGRKTVVIFSCAATFSGIPEVVRSTECENYVHWNTNYGFRVCVPDDCEEVRGACTGGKSTVRLQKKHGVLCLKTETEAREESCSTLQVPVVGIVLVVCFAVALLGAICVALFLHRKVSKKYNLLIEQTPDELD